MSTICRLRHLLSRSIEGAVEILYVHTRYL